MKKETRQTSGPMAKTYEVYGVIEWVILLPTGSDFMPSVEIRFEGGQLTGYGVTPARFTTSDPFLQNLVEATAWYGKKITLQGAGG